MGPKWNLGKRLFLIHALPLHLCHYLLLFSLLTLKSVITPLLSLLFSGHFVTLHYLAPEVTMSSAGCSYARFADVAHAVNEQNLNVTEYVARCDDACLTIFGLGKLGKLV
jgi:hypothetical protein